MNASAQVLGEDQFVLGLEAMCLSQGLHVDRRLALQQFPPPFTLKSLAAAANAMGLTATLLRFRTTRPPKSNCLMALGPIESQALPAGHPVGESPLPEVPGMSLRSFEADSRLLRELDRDAPAVPIDQLRERLLGVAIRVDRGHAGLDKDPDAQARRREAFGFRWFVPELARHRRTWGEVLFASMVIQVMALALPLITQNLIDKVIVHQALSTLWVLGIALGIVILFTGAMTWVRQQLVLYAGNRIDSVLGNKVFGHLMDLPPRWFEHRSTGTITARLHGIETIREFLSGAMVMVALDLPFMAIFLAIMLWYSWQLTAVAMASLILVAVLSIAIAPLLRHRLNRQFLTGARTQAFLTEYVSGMDTVKSLQLEPRLKDRYAHFLDDYLKETLAARQLSNTLSTSASMLEQLSSALVLCLGAWLVMQNTGFTIGMLVAFQMFSSRLSQPLLRLSGLWQEFQQANIAVKRLGDLLDAPAESVDMALRHPEPRAGSIRLEQVSFRHAQNLPLLYEGLSLDIAPGECVLVTGASGCGKSTLAKLLLGFYAPDKGRILIDGRDIAGMATNELRSHFGVVPQESTLFSGTLLDNLAADGGSSEDVVSACRLAGVHAVISALPHGYQTRIGEHGAGLSGGQRQRICIARALLRRPTILIFDEAISQLDAVSVAEVVGTLNSLSGKVTVVFIAHSVPAGMRYDRDIVLSPDNMFSPGKGH